VLTLFRLSTVDLLHKIVCFVKKLMFALSKAADLNYSVQGQIKCAEFSPSVRVPWFMIMLYVIIRRGCNTCLSGHDPRLTINPILSSFAIDNVLQFYIRLITFNAKTYYFKITNNVKKI
jgi:hypothetical protein